MSDSVGNSGRLRTMKHVTTPGVARGKAAKQPEIGQRFGRLVVKGAAGQNLAGNHLWRCDCDCGGSAIRRTGYLNLVKVAGCEGCQSARRAIVHITHGETPRANARTRSRLYNVWSNMRQRCSNPKDAYWHVYGGKGVRVCDEWQDFETFRAWAQSHGFQSLLTIDRLDANSNYEPSNCEWVTRSENSRRMWATRSAEQRTAEGKERQGRAFERIRQRAVADYIAQQATLAALYPVGGC